MFDFSDSGLLKIAVHFVGNKIQEENLNISDDELKLDDSVRELLKKYFTKFFSEQPYHQFYHESNLLFNECYVYAKEIFEDPGKLYFNSIKLAKHLYAVSDHPNIKSGEFYVTFFEQIYAGDEMCDAIGIFKSENKETYLKVYPENNNFKIESENGVNINKLDKGCLILNSDQENGYKVVIIDQTNKTNEAQYWSNKFLKVKPLKDNYYHTQNYLMMCRDFALESFPASSKADKLSLANETEKFFGEQDSFDKISYQEKVLQEPEIINAFENYKTNYQKERDVEIIDEFDVSIPAMKKLKRVFKSVIKLDKNFHIYIHGNRNLIHKGFDEESGLNYYQVFYKEES